MTLALLLQHCQVTLKGSQPHTTFSGLWKAGIINCPKCLLFFLFIVSFHYSQIFVCVCLFFFLLSVRMESSEALSKSWLSQTHINFCLLSGNITVSQRRAYLTRCGSQEASTMIYCGSTLLFQLTVRCRLQQGIHCVKRLSGHISTQPSDSCTSPSSKVCHKSAIQEAMQFLDTTENNTLLLYKNRFK